MAYMLPTVKYGAISTSYMQCNHIYINPYRGSRSIHTNGNAYWWDIRWSEQPQLTICWYVQLPQVPLIYGPVTGNTDCIRTYSIKYKSPPSTSIPTSKYLQAPLLLHKTFLTKHHFSDASAIKISSPHCWLDLTHIFRFNPANFFPIEFDSHCMYFILDLSHIIQVPFD